VQGPAAGPGGGQRAPAGSDAVVRPAPEQAAAAPGQRPLDPDRFEARDSDFFPASYGAGVCGACGGSRSAFAGSTPARDRVRPVWAVDRWRWRCRSGRGWLHRREREGTPDAPLQPPWIGAQLKDPAGASAATPGCCMVPEWAGPIRHWRWRWRAAWLCEQPTEQGACGAVRQLPCDRRAHARRPVRADAGDGDAGARLAAAGEGPGRARRQEAQAQQGDPHRCAARRGGFLAAHQRQAGRGKVVSGLSGRPHEPPSPRMRCSRRWRSRRATSALCWPPKTRTSCCRRSAAAAWATRWLAGYRRRRPTGWRSSRSHRKPRGPGCARPAAGRPTPCCWPAPDREPESWSHCFRKGPAAGDSQPAAGLAGARGPRHAAQAVPRPAAARQGAEPRLFRCAKDLPSGIPDFQALSRWGA
jgi:hypothetical protein